jgi:hypothetical protein
MFDQLCAERDRSLWLSILNLALRVCLVKRAKPNRTAVWRPGYNRSVRRSFVI